MTQTWYPGAHVDRIGDKRAVILASTGAHRTYRQLDAIANRVGRLLRDHGLRPGDHVSLWFDNELDYPGYWWGAHYAGLHYTLVGARLTPAEAAYIVGDSGSSVVIVGRLLAEAHAARLAELVGPDVRVIVDDDSPDGLQAALATVEPTPWPDRVDGAPMLYSSGTTGQPKGVKRALPVQPLGTPGLALLFKLLFELGEDSVYLSPAPLYHAAPYGFVTATTSMGGSAVIMERFDAEAMLAAVERYRVTHIQLVPTMFIRLLALPEKVRQSYDLSSLRCAIHAAAPCPIPVKEQMLEWWGPIIHEYYSGTEGAGFVHCAPADWPAHRGSVGRALIGEIHIVDDDGREVGPGVDGTVFFAGGPAFEYHNDSEKTESAHLPNGWATLGDIGHLDADGFLYLTDRRSNMIIVGGVNVYPQEAENVLATHPAVHDAAVIGIPHGELGEEVKALIQPAEGVEPGDELAAELIDYCRAQLASIKCPRTVEFRNSLPREPTGKLLKRLLCEDYLAPTEGGDVA